MKTVPVSLGSRSYEILIGSGLLPGLGSRMRDLKLSGRCAVLTDSNVGPRFGAAVVKSLKAAGFEPVVVKLPAGETTKSLRNVERCHEALAKERLERKSAVVALGGGVIGDLAGFVAATYLRGVPFVQIPTSLLAQVDSSVGGKTGVNLKAGKNLVGAFYQPRLVLCDMDTLRTLPEREFRSGLAEVIKYGIIQDPELFGLIEDKLPLILRRSPALLARIIARSCEIKADVVSQDETETGLRATLNFGHTLGHAIEAIAGYGKYLHGEAISIGQVLAAELSAMQAGLPAADVARIRSIFDRAGLPTSIRLGTAQRKRLFEAMLRDKKVSAGRIRFVLARAIGKVEWGCEVPSDAIVKCLGPS